jgi:co-chaperonin GroES (HSP10)
VNDDGPNIVAEDLVRINDSGIDPFQFQVLVLPDESEVELRARRSGLVVPDDAAGIYRHAAVTGRIIAMSPAAFSYHDWPEGCRLPMVGDRVSFARYAGVRQNGRPKVNEKGHEESIEYRQINDKDILSVLKF